jgi:hypothetical protein
MRADDALLKTEDTSNGPWLAALSLLAVISMSGSSDAADKPDAEPSAAQRIMQLPSRLPGLFRRETASGSESKAGSPSTQAAPSQAHTVSVPAVTTQDPGLQRAREMLIEARLRETRGDLAGALDLAERAEQVRLGAERTRGARWPASEPAPRDYIARLEARMVARSTAAVAGKSAAPPVPLTRESRTGSESQSDTAPATPVVSGPVAASSSATVTQAEQIPANAAQTPAQLPVAELFGLNETDSAVTATAATLEPRFDDMDPAVASSSEASPSTASLSARPAETPPAKDAPGLSGPAPAPSLTPSASGTGPAPEPVSPVLTRKTLEEQLASRMSGAIAGRSSTGRTAAPADSSLTGSIGVFSPVTSPASPSTAPDLLAPSLTARQAASAAGAIVQIAAPIAQQIIPEKSAEQLKKVSEQSRAVIETAKTIHQVAQETGVIQAGGPETQAGQSGPASEIPGVLMDGLDKLESWIPDSQTQSGSTKEPAPQVEPSAQPPLAIPDLLDNGRQINDQDVSPIPTHMVPGRTSSSAKAIEINPGAGITDAVDGSGRVEAPLLLHPESSGKPEAGIAPAAGGLSLFTLFLTQIVGGFAGTMLAVGACLLIRQRLRKSGQIAAPARPVTPARTAEESTADVVPFPGAAEPRPAEKIGKAA